MYNKYVKELIGCKEVNVLGIEEIKKLYRTLLLESYSGNVVLLKVQDEHRLKEIYSKHDVVRVEYNVTWSYKLFYEGFMEAYNNILASNGLEVYFEKNNEDKIKYIGMKYHKMPYANAYDTVREKLFNCEEYRDDSDYLYGSYNSYDIIFELKDHRYIFIIYEDKATRDKVVDVSSEVIQGFIDKMILDKYKTQKGDKKDVVGENQ